MRKLGPTRASSAAAAVVGLFAAALLAAPALAQIPRIQRPPSIQSRPPAGGVPQRGEGNFDWQRLTEGLIRGLQESPGVRPQPIRPIRPIPPQPDYPDPDDLRPVYPQPMPIQPIYPQPIYPQPTYPQPIPTQPVYPEPSYSQPISPQPPLRTERVERPQVIPLPSNVITPPKPVVPKIPPQPSPFGERVWEVSLREAHCYGDELRGMTLAGLANFRRSLGKLGGPGTPLHEQLEQVGQMLAEGRQWRELEPVMQRLLDQNRSVFSGRLLEQWQTLLRLALVRDAFAVAANASPRGRGEPLAVAAIPTGIIWIVYDPTLPAGVALLVSERVLVCGGGTGAELRVVSSSAAEALGLPVAPGEPEPDLAADEARELSRSIVITHSKDAATKVNYLLNNQYSYAIEPGHTQKLDADRSWLIEFDRGGGRGAARYRLTKGTYEFRIVDGRWDLVRLNYRIQIDNTAGKQDFRYLINNEVVTVKAGETKEHKTNEAIILEFDRGEGAEQPARKNLNKNGTYKVAIDTDTNYLDLFATETT